MINLDKYENLFIEKKLEHVGEAKSFQKSLILECLELFQCCLDSKSKDKLIELWSDELITRMINYVDRSIFYENLFIFWDKKLVSKNSNIFTIENAIHTFYPIFCQEIEGPLKNCLLVVDFILRVKGKEELTWSNFKYKKNNKRTNNYKYIPEILSSLEGSSKNTKFIKEVVNGLNSDPLKIRTLRNAGAHSNYIYYKDINSIMIYSENSEAVKIPAMSFLQLFSMTEDLLTIFHLIIHLGCRRIEVLK
ncbi:MAG: hypothetical protein MPEBLZ_02145 [Candidatus Methanoperedens nitroreducens]|uniref:Uncharacterized protein n=1 Tax=Candidatus Methanoperedens nitratireducens TaxID=1392998 RepID=A0A0P8A9J3_9EURY|nr:hypothetical protein [Candidatus Methanoperedens sp. BLZ2]KAB2944683.1 MAG: hypothetical protein F9K14_13625 [Candidatus Methanoperedens sp.]KPQ43302.1 MAG: hypothetical protein MPEBLZ_02145 [Candidatus Methanoperedens sp. BLZ1]MBZ0175890.1 hypothetical protein [Candidatus Methanoperedens nitroreducens]CAG0981985.1 hypothetical protein METP2_02033 [Methanosarcinales archaeon]MCX9076402.1 hypothetical protein [Candidatus Methanoperedens sp.]